MGFDLQKHSAKKADFMSVEALSGCYDFVYDSLEVNGRGKAL
jgi:hypothetical protein